MKDRPSKRASTDPGTQVVAELAATRDALKASADLQIGTSPKDVIDVVVVAHRVLIATEAKFFGRSNVALINLQLATQRGALEVFSKSASFGIDRICHVFLTADRAIQPEQLNCDGVIYWHEILDLCDLLLGASSYVSDRLRSGLERHAREFSAVTPADWTNVPGLDALRALCRERGREIEIGYIHGLDHLMRAPLSALRSRVQPWKIREAATRLPSPRWVLGDAFERAIIAKEGDPFTATSAQTGATRATPANRKFWIERISYEEAIALARKRGDAIVLGVNGGGARALRSMSPAEIRNRRYPWDEAIGGYPGKQASNWLDGGRFLDALRDMELIGRA